MIWLFPSIVATLIGTIVLAATYFFLYRTEEKAYLSIWAIAWGVYAARFVFMLLYLSLDSDKYKPIVLIANQLASLGSGFLLLWGSYVFSHRKFPRRWVYISVAVSIYIIILGTISSPLFWLSLPTFIFLGCIFIWTGIIFLRQGAVYENAAKIVGISFILWGLHKINYPILRPVSWFAPWGYLLGAALEMVIAIGMIMAYFQRAQKKIKDDKERLRLSLAGSGTGFWEWYPGLGSIDFDDNWAINLGYSPGEKAFDFEWWNESVHADSKPVFESALKDYLEGRKQRYELEYRIQTKTGDWKWIWAAGECIEWDKKNNPVRFLGTHRDITESKRFENELQQMEERYRLIAENMTDLVALSDSDARFSYVSPSYRRVLGYDPETLVGKPIWELVHPDDLPSIVSLIDEHQDEKNPVTSTYRMKHKSGTYLWFETVGRVVFDEEQNPFGAVFNTRDITARRDSESERERLLFAIEQADEIVSITDMEGTIQYVNTAFEKITGYSRQEALGQNPRILKSGSHDQAFYKRLWRQILSGHQWVGRMKNRRKDGSIYTAECSISPVKDVSGTVLNFVWISRDITKELELEEKVIQAQKMESIGNLAGGIAHDFNNILSSIIGYTELALDDAGKGSSLEDSLQEIYSAGKRARDLVKQILTFARQSDEEQKPVKIGAIAKEALKLVQATSPATIEIRQNIQSNSLVIGSSTQLLQVFINLCTNAVQAMGDSDGRLTVDLVDVEPDGMFPQVPSGAKSGSFVKIIISDTGCGIDPSIIGSIFEPYFTSKGIGEGTGMGLALVHGIVVSHGGKITVESKLGEGTLFSVYLPISRKLDVDHIHEQEELPLGNERILFVDDELPITKTSSQILERLGYKVTVRSNSLAALELFRSRPNDFDLVITDMTMPRMTGDQLAVEMMQIRPEIPVILCTGYSKKMSAASAAKIGIKGFVHKPIIKSDLAKSIRKVLDEANGTDY